MDDSAGMLCKLIAKEILKDPKLEITETEPLITSGLLDSFNLVDLAILIEDKYGVRIEDYELNADTFDTVQKLSEIISSRL